MKEGAWGGCRVPLIRFLTVLVLRCSRVGGQPAVGSRRPPPEQAAAEEVRLGVLREGVHGEEEPLAVSPRLARTQVVAQIAGFAQNSLVHYADNCPSRLCLPTLFYRLPFATSFTEHARGQRDFRCRPRSLSPPQVEDSRGRRRRHDCGKGCAGTSVVPMAPGCPLTIESLR